MTCDQRQNVARKNVSVHVCIQSLMEKNKAYQNMVVEHLPTKINTYCTNILRIFNLLIFYFSFLFPK